MSRRSGAEFADAGYFGVSGHRGHISEVAAIQRALRELPGEFDAIASLGGESFLVYHLADGRITSVLSHNKCAAGSGEFLVQQIGRMGLELEDAIRRSFHGRVVPLASRCSVHCKSDITHKLNRQEATPEDILHTLQDSMAEKVVSLLEKGQGPLRRVLVIGGLARNAALALAAPAPVQLKATCAAFINSDIGPFNCLPLPLSSSLRIVDPGDRGLPEIGADRHLLRETGTVGLYSGSR